MIKPASPTVRFARHRRQVPRRGLVLVAALAVLVVVVSLIGTMLKSALQNRRQLHNERNRRQAELMLQAGVERAVGRLAAEPQFAGDTWSLPRDSVASRGDGRVVTEVTRQNDSKIMVSVIAEFPLDRDFPIRRSRKFQLTPSSNSNQE